MKKNLNKLGGLHKSQNILLALIKQGLSRKEAYIIIQTAANKSMDSNSRFEDIIKNDKKIIKYLNINDLEKLFFSEDKVKHIDNIFRKAFKL